MVVVEGGHPRPSVSPQAAAGCRGHAHLLRRGRPDGAHPGPVHGRPRPLQALRLQRRCHHPVPVRPRRRRLRLPAGLRHPLLWCAPRQGEVWASSSTLSPSPSHPAVPAEVPRNDTCPELPDIANGWKTASQPELLHGTVVTFHCYPGFELAGTDLLMCHWDLTWSGDLPSCERGERGHAPPVSPPRHPIPLPPSPPRPFHPQSPPAGTPGTPSTAAGWSPAPNSRWGPPCASSATRATCWRAPGSSPATTAPRGAPNGATACPSASVSRGAHPPRGAGVHPRGGGFGRAGGDVAVPLPSQRRRTSPATTLACPRAGGRAPSGGCTRRGPRCASPAPPAGRCWARAACAACPATPRAGAAPPPSAKRVSGPPPPAPTPLRTPPQKTSPH